MQPVPGASRWLLEIGWGGCHQQIAGAIKPSKPSDLWTPMPTRTVMPLTIWNPQTAVCRTAKNTCQ
eukprot:1321942-Lingulodinium_polyedra.AAC.1